MEEVEEEEEEEEQEEEEAEVEEEEEVEAASSSLGHFRLWFPPPAEAGGEEPTLCPPE